MTDGMLSKTDFASVRPSSSTLTVTFFFPPKTLLNSLNGMIASGPASPTSPIMGFVTTPPSAKAPNENAAMVAIAAATKATPANVPTENGIPKMLNASAAAIDVKNSITAEPICMNIGMMVSMKNPWMAPVIAPNAPMTAPDVADQIPTTPVAVADSPAIIDAFLACMIPTSVVADAS